MSPGLFRLCASRTAQPAALASEGQVLLDGVDQVAAFMVVSARTAPQSKGEDFVQTRVLQGESIRELAEAMIDFGQPSGKSTFFH